MGAWRGEASRDTHVPRREGAEAILPLPCGPFELPETWAPSPRLPAPRLGEGWSGWWGAAHPPRREAEESSRLGSLGVGPFGRSAGQRPLSNSSCLHPGTSRRVRPRSPSTSAQRQAQPGSGATSPSGQRLPARVPQDPELGHPRSLARASSAVASAVRRPWRRGGYSDAGTPRAPPDLDAAGSPRADFPEGGFRIQGRGGLVSGSSAPSRTRGLAGPTSGQAAWGTGLGGPSSSGNYPPWARKLENPNTPGEASSL